MTHAPACAVCGHPVVATKHHDVPAPRAAKMFPRFTCRCGKFARVRCSNGLGTFWVECEDGHERRKYSSEVAVDDQGASLNRPALPLHGRTKPTAKKAKRRAVARPPASPTRDLPLPVEPAPDLLPLADPAFDWRRFERFCRALVSKLPSVITCSHYGRPGNKQRGIDLVATMTDGGERTYQCRQWRRFSASHGEKVVEGAPRQQGPKPAEFTERSFAAVAATLETRTDLAQVFPTV